MSSKRNSGKINDEYKRFKRRRHQHCSKIEDKQLHIGEPQERQQIITKSLIVYTQSTNIELNNTIFENTNVEDTCTESSDGNNSDASVFSAVESNQDTVILDFKKYTFIDKLREWAIKGNIKLTEVSNLLKILVHDGNHVELPTDARALLKTPRSANVRELDNGHYVHLGIKNYLNILFTNNEQRMVKLEKLQFSFNVDGTPITLSGGCTFWPILGNISNAFDKSHVFAIGIFAGPSKPQSFNNFLMEFVEEIENLITNSYIWKDKMYPVEIKAFICDAPALACLKGVKSHGGYYCCTKCFIKGVNVENSSTIVYIDLISPQRTDVLFRNRKMISGSDDIGHHTNQDKSVLERLPIDMIKCFPLDKMHLIDEGVVKKLIKLWLGKPNPQKLSSCEISQINDRIKMCYNYTPKEFQRKPRTLKYAHFFKANECRVFLLYTGPIILKGILKNSAYVHFMTLSLAVRILTSHVYYSSNNQYANDLLTYFVKHFIKLYGQKYASYNIHGLLHIAEDARYLGPLDENSCYMFEAFIKVIKQMLHSFNRPLQQCSNRIYEMSRINASINENNTDEVIFLRPIPNSNKFYTAKFSNFKLHANLKGNNCVMLKSMQIICIKYFTYTINNVQIVVGKTFKKTKHIIDTKYLQLENFYFFIGNFENEVTVNVTDILCKMCCFPTTDNEFFVVPLNHTLKLLYSNR
ncbi:hypothetical protein RI129_002410 [Pyrocoelia pectoralis]|uniref:Transposase domain-containing protein n=1 Tax=Pyrocoelia pectoralis TaxID=417401 RepID=A0AAN7VMJ1_9COLE